MIRRVALDVAGRVQGVSYRFAAKTKAQELSISGFVRNEPDGTVYMEAEGTSENLERFIEWAKKGPLWAKVQKVEIEEREVEGPKDFEVL